MKTHLLFLALALGFVTGSILGLAGGVLIGSNVESRSTAAASSVAGPRGTRSQNPAPAPGSKLWPREEFRSAVMGKSREEISALLGKPAKTSDLYWAYVKLTVDEANGKTDATVMLWFKNGVVERLVF
jgi:hypothetical protein